MHMHSVFMWHIERLRRLVVAMELGIEEGQDILQDVYIEAVKGPGKFRSEGEASRWLMRVTANRCLLEFRRRRRHRRAASEVVKQWAELAKSDSGPDKQAIATEEAEAMMQCLRQMDESLQVPLAMRYFGDLNSTEIGEILETYPETAAARRMARAVVEFLVRDEKPSVRRMKKRHIEKLSRMQDEIRGAIATVEEQIEAKGSEVPAAYKKYEDAIRNSSYSLHPSSQVPEEVRKTIFEMDKMLDVLNIEIAGIQSKLSAIKKYSAQKDVLLSQTLTLTLREMAIRQEIELVGAESRRQAIMSVKRREEALYSQYEAFRDLKNEIEALKSDVRRDQKELERLDRDIDFLGPGELTFIIEGTPPSANHVVIQPIRVKERADLAPR